MGLGPRLIEQPSGTLERVATFLHVLGNSVRITVADVLHPEPGIARRACHFARDAAAEPMDGPEGEVGDARRPRAEHVRFHIETGIPIYCCDPRSPWHRPASENTNGLVRQYAPQGADLTRYTQRDLDTVARELKRPSSTKARLEETV